MAYDLVVGLLWGDNKGVRALLIIYRPNLGRGRWVPPGFRREELGTGTNGPLFHRSVQFRINALRYNPRARYMRGTETYES
jgi:hypothetical protein